MKILKKFTVAALTLFISNSYADSTEHTFDISDTSWATETSSPITFATGDYVSFIINNAANENDMDNSYLEAATWFVNGDTSTFGAAEFTFSQNTALSDFFSVDATGDWSLTVGGSSQPTSLINMSGLASGYAARLGQGNINSLSLTPFQQPEIFATNSDSPHTFFETEDPTEPPTVPEPPVTLLLFLGLACIVGVQRKHNKGNTEPLPHYTNSASV